MNPSTTVNPVSNIAYCNNATTLPISLTSPVTGTTFTWTNSNAAIGLAVSGSGNIPSFTATNGGVTPIVATITVTPSASGCTGIPLTFTITVNPNAVPTLTGPLTMCVGTPGNLYSTDNGMSSYVWNVSAGGNITSGGTATSNTVTVTWNTAGAQTVSVNYTNTNGCTSPSPTPVTINVTPLPTTSPIYHN